MTDLESPRKNNDCYFYYYSTCTKGDSCTFRHEPSALGCETTCSFWKEGKCINVHCNFRHMELRKNRKTIPCYWEAQPSGCKKPHCPFMHIAKKHADGQDDEPTANLDNDEVCSVKSKQDDFTAPVVDPIVVNFEEESDNESSTPTLTYHHKTSNQSHDHHQQAPHCDQTVHEQQPQPPNQAHTLFKPIRAQNVGVKTLEEIKLDRIQAESAAYYSYSDELTPAAPEANGRTTNVFNRLQPLSAFQAKQKEVDIENIQVLSLDEIRKRKRRVENSEDASLQTEDIPKESITKKQKVQTETKSQPPIETSKQQPRKVVLAKTKAAPKDISEIKIKTLAEIKAERLLKRKLEEESVVECSSGAMNTTSLSNKKIRTNDEGSPSQLEVSEQEVSSTSKSDENQAIPSSNPLPDLCPKVQCIVAPVKRQLDVPTETITKESHVQSFEKVPSEGASETDVSSTPKEEAVVTKEEKEGVKQVQIPVVAESVLNESKATDENKLDELLLEGDDDDDDGHSLSLRAEDDILKDIDNLLNE